MIAVTVAELARLLGVGLGPGVAGAAADGPVRDLVVDSRRAGPGALFVALDGERVDGHAFVGSAFARGALAAVTARPVPDAAGPCLVVADPLVALGRVARDQVDRGIAGGLRVAAITGSQGKTSTKDLLAQVLEPIGPTVAPHGNLNNEIGLPLTIARLTADTRYLVAEMGARGVGHIGYLCTIAPPQVSAVLNVGHAHLGEFGSREAIARAKGEIVEALPATGVAVLNADDPLVWAMRARTAAEPLGFAVGRDPGTGRAVWAEDLTADPLGQCRFTLSVRVGPSRSQVEVQLAVSGLHQVPNALAAAGIAVALGLDAAQVASGLTAARSRSRLRMELHTRSDGLLVVNDAYNANPDSMRAALDAAARIGAERPGRTWAVLGDMLELGAEAESEHEALGRYAADRVDVLVLVGSLVRATAAGARAQGGAQVEGVLDKEAAAALVGGQAGAGDTVLVKASRGLALETVADAVLTGAPTPRPGRPGDDPPGSGSEESPDDRAGETTSGRPTSEDSA